MHFKLLHTFMALSRVMDKINLLFPFFSLFLIFLLYVEINRLLKKVLEGLWLFFIMI